MTDGPAGAPFQAGPERPVTAPSRPLRTVGWGLVLAFFDLRLGGFDVLPDALGWFLVALGIGRLPFAAAGERTARLASVARVVAVVAAVGSLPDLVGVGARVGTRPSPSVAALAIVLAVLFTVGGAAFARAVAGLAAAADDEAGERVWLSVGSWFLVTSAAAAVLAAVSLLGLLALPLALVVFLAGAVVTVWMTYRCFADSNRPWALPGGRPA